MMYLHVSIQCSAS